MDRPSAPCGVVVTPVDTWGVFLLAFPLRGLVPAPFGESTPLPPGRIPAPWGPPTDTPLGYILGGKDERGRPMGDEEEPPMKDPVCGMDVRPETASAAWEHAGETYYFCSVGCMEAFRLDPDRYLAMDPRDRHM